jgi:hypothetical protein
MALRTEEQRRAVRYRRVSKLTLRYLGRIAVILFVFWHFFAIAVWLMPAGSEISNRGMPYVRPYMTATGFMQGWSMFAPQPYSLDLFIEARIHYADGRVKSWKFHRVSEMSYWRRYGKERWRKYTEVANQDQFKFLWHSSARYAARVNNVYPANPPVSVELIRHFRFVQPPAQVVSPQTMYTPWQSIRYTTQPIKREELR